MFDLSILIPARKELHLAKTVEDILKNIRGNTEIIIVLDGEWADPGIPDNDRVRIVYHPEPVGQRAATNEACRLSKAKYVMKVDAHCAFDEGFDQKMLDAYKELDDNVTMVPVMRNLHVFDWVCPDGHRRYQSPSGNCKECGKETQRDIVWIPKSSPQSTSYCFDPEPHFQYFNEYKSRQIGDLVETMSLQGSAFMCTRERYWALNLCDEAFGSWGSQGIEVAVKTWLSGGRVICNTRTWYAHMFRTQGGDFGFPYHQQQSKVEEAKAYARKQFFDGEWKGAKYPLSWLVEKFWPVYGWTEADLQKIKGKAPTGKGIIFYTDNQLNVKLAHRVQNQIKRMGLPIVSSSLKPMPKMGKNIYINAERGYMTMFKQIIAALEASDSEVIFFCEHDVLYHPSHFLFTPTSRNKFFYNRNWWRIREDGFAARWDANQVSGLVCYREHALNYYRERLRELDTKEFNRSYEPGGRDPAQYEVFMSAYPNIDIRHKGTLTKDKWKPEDFRDKSTGQNWQESDVDHIPGWTRQQILG